MNNNSTASCCVLTCYYQPNPGGLCNRLFRGIQALLDRDHTVHYLSVVPFPINHPNCHFHRFPWPMKDTSSYLFWLYFHAVAPPILFFIGIKYRVNRLVALGHTYAFLLQPLRLIRNIPLFLFLHSDVQKTHQIKGRSYILMYMEYIIEGLGISGTESYSVSEALMKTINVRHSILKPKSIGVLRNEIATLQNGKIKSKQNIQFPIRVACVGVLEPRKNQRFILDVFKKIASEQAQLFLYGVGPDEQLLKSKVKKEGLIDRVHFMGWVQSDKIWSDVDLLLMPSLHEGAPLAVLEALGHGIPVFASDIPEHEEILPRKYLRSVDSDSCASWSKLIEEAVRQNNLASIAEDQRNCARKLFFDWDSKFVELIVKQN